MAKKKVVNYIREQLQNGHSISQIRNVMLKYGYSSTDIEEAVDEIYHPTIRHEIHLSKATIITVVLIAVLAIGTFSFFYFEPKSSQLLDLNLEPVSTNVRPGEQVIFVKELSNLGSAKRYDVVIKQELIDKSNFKVIAEKTETRAIETFGATQTSMSVPNDAKEGDYILRVSVDYENKKAIATLDVKIAPINGSKTIETCFDNVKNQNEDEIDCGGACKPCERGLNCNDNNACTSDVVENGKCVNKPIVPCCGNNNCEANEQKTCEKDCKSQLSELPSDESIDKIRETAKTNPGKALQECSKIEFSGTKDACIANIAEVQRSEEYCKGISDSRTRDLCYSSIAKLVNDNSICEQISTESRRDNCYMTFVLDNKDYSVCGKLVNSALRQSCNSLKQLSSISQQAVQLNQSNNS